jgi:cytochrome c6
VDGQTVWKVARTLGAVLGAGAMVLSTGCTGTGGDTDFATSAEERALAIDGDPQVGEEVFNERAEPTCASCHALAAAGSTAETGPDLDARQPGAAGVVRALIAGDQGIHDPDYLPQLSLEEIAGVAAYIARSTRPD